MTRGIRVYLSAAEAQLVLDALTRHQVWTTNDLETRHEDWDENNKDQELIASVDRKILRARARAMVKGAEL